ncbi:hypothetical protein ACU4GR_12785 [Methylobacterium oryzae CBMB20]
MVAWNLYCVAYRRHLLEVFALLAYTLQIGIGGLFEPALKEPYPDPIAVFEKDRSELQLWWAGITSSC